MKVLLISNMYPSSKYPVFGIFVKNFEQGIIDNGGQVIKSVIKGRGQGVLHKSIKYFLFFISVYKKIFFGRYDVVYVHYTAHSMLPLVPIRWLVKKPLIINAHGDDLIPTTKFSRIIQRLTCSSVKSAAMLVTPSLYFKKLAEQIYGHNNIIISPSGGVDLCHFKSLYKVDKNNDDIVLGYVSRIDEGKGWDVFLKALYLLKTNYPHVKFQAYIAGHGAQIDNMQAMIARCGLEHKVRYLGRLPQEDLPEVYNLFDLFVFPSVLRESLGLVGLESMASGVPVIGTDAGGISEYVIEGKNGFLFPQGDSVALATKIAAFYDLSAEEKLSLSNNALFTATEFCSRNVAANLYAEIEEVIYR